jgi:hypothetical protein
MNEKQKIYKREFIKKCIIAGKEHSTHYSNEVVSQNLNQALIREYVQKSNPNIDKIRFSKKVFKRKKHNTVNKKCKSQKK